MGIKENSAQRGAVRKGRPADAGTKVGEMGPFTAAERGSLAHDAKKEDILAIIDNAPCGIVVNKWPAGKVLYINKKSLEMTGYTVADVPSATMAERAFSPDPKARRKMRAVRIAGERMLEDGGTLVNVAPGVCKDGSVKVFEITAALIGTRKKFVSMWVDVTRREEAEAQVKESESRFRSFFEESAEATLLFDGETVTDCNPAAQILLGFASREEALGMTFPLMSPGEDPGETERKLGRLTARARKKKSHRFEWTFMRRDGSVFPAEVIMTAMKVQAEKIFHVTMRDISSWKEAERGMLTSACELERRVQARTRELGAVNRRLLREIEARNEVERELEASREELRHLSEHIQRAREKERARIAREVHDELGQSLSAIKIDVASLGDSMPQVYTALREQAKAIESRVDRAVSAVRDICLELRPPVLDHFGLTAAVEWYLSDFAKRTGIACGADIDRSLVVGDEGLAIMLFRILQEAMTNILRHAGARYVEVSLKADHGNLTLRVKDDGKGISEEEVSHRRSFGIIGIQERVRFWGGKSQLQGTPGKGTTMTVSVPLRPAEGVIPGRGDDEGKAGA